ARTEEEVLTYALFPQVAREYLTDKYADKEEKNTTQERIVKEINVFY
ncbi:MAG: hypothetical protein IJG31_03845, partial [Fusobacterium sp.]|nr:hypothetical protein [Fusobacterium sp.]